MKGPSILIIEDDIVTSVALAKALQAELPDGRIHRATTLFESRLILTSFDIRFFIIDVNLPDGNGIDFIMDVTSKDAGAGVVVMSSDTLPTNRERATSSGALTFMEKPVPPRTLGQIIRNHHEAAQGADTSFSASLTRLSVIDVVQLKCLGHASLRLDFTLRDGRYGSIHFNDGQIIHAESHPHTKAEKVVGLAALAEILTWRGGRIVEVKNAPTPPPTLEGSWQALLLQAAQEGDESLSRSPNPSIS